MTKNLFIKKCRNNYNTGTVYTLTWVSRIDDSTHTETILSMDINPISEDHIKNILVTKAAQDDVYSFLATVSECLPVQEDGLSDNGIEIRESD